MPFAAVARTRVATPTRRDRQHGKRWCPGLTHPAIAVALVRALHTLHEPTGRLSGRGVLFFENGPRCPRASLVTTGPAANGSRLSCGRLAAAQGCGTKSVAPPGAQHSASFRTITARQLQALVRRHHPSTVPHWYRPGISAAPNRLGGVHTKAPTRPRTVKNGTRVIGGAAPP